MPLVSEHIKLLRSLWEEHVFDMPPQPRRRYQIDGVHSRHVSWRRNQKTQVIAAGKILRVELPEPALVHRSRENWRTSRDVMTTAAPFGMHVVDLDVAGLGVGEEIVFTLYQNDERRWDRQDFRVRIV